MTRGMIDALADRVAKVEHAIEKVILPDMEQAKLERAAMKDDTEQILAFVSGAQKAGSIAVRFGPKLITFGAGIFTAAGIGNPKVWAFVSGFFGA